MIDTAEELARTTTAQRFSSSLCNARETEKIKMNCPIIDAIYRLFRRKSVKI